MDFTHRDLRVIGKRVFRLGLAANYGIEEARFTKPVYPGSTIQVKFTVKEKVDQEKKIWNCAMRIPWKSVDERPVAADREYRINFYRIEGDKPNRVFMAWSPTGVPSYHTPSAFGRLKLAK